MDEKAVKGQWQWIVSGGWVALIGAAFTLLGACSPSFELNACEEDLDCFPDERCQQGACVLASQFISPRITRFQAEDSTLFADELVTLSWSIENASVAELVGTVGESEVVRYAIGDEELAQGTYETRLEASTDFVLRASSGSETVENRLTVQVENRQPPQIIAFDADESQVEEGGTVTLSWETSGATAGSLFQRTATEEIPALSLDASALERGSVEVTVDSPTRYTLAVSNAAGVDTQVIGVGLKGVAPQILAFEASPDTVIIGEEVALSWSIVGADQVEVFDENAGSAVDLTGIAVNEGLVRVPIVRNNVFRLVASNPAGTSEESVAVTVREDLVVTRFEAIPAVIRNGESTQLLWEVNGADATTALTVRDDSGAEVDTGAASVSSGMVSVTPTRTTTYTLEVSTAREMDSEFVEVTVLPGSPAILAFDADSVRIAPGSTVTLSWVVDGADQLQLESDRGGSIDISSLDVANDSIELAVSEDTVFMLTAINAGGMETAMVSVEVVSPVAIQSFDASSDRILGGDDVTLSWQVEHATALSLQTQGGTPINISGLSLTQDSIMLAPTSTTTYVLQAEGFNGPVEAMVTVDVTPRVSILSFGAAPNPAPSGGSVTLQWQTVAATSIQLDYTTASGQMGTVNVGGLDPLMDSVVVTPTEDTTYTLVATDGMRTAQAPVSVDVFVPAAILSFTITPSTVSAGNTVTLDWETQGALDLAITDLDGNMVDTMGLDLAMDSVTITPTETTTYFLSITGDNSTSDSDQVDVTVQP